MNAANLGRLAEIEGVHVDLFREDFENYDIVLFMGYDPRIAEARAANPTAKIGVVDPRPGFMPNVRDADFVVVNGLEMKDFCANHFAEIFVYHIYPELTIRTQPRSRTAADDSIVLGYHGNRSHLHGMYPYVATALELLAQTHVVRLLAIYNVEKLGKLGFDLCNRENFTIEHIQWHPDVYDEFLPSVDIGLVPGLTPVRNVPETNRRISTFPTVFGQHDSDVLLRFKATSNAGRIFVFSQYGIPVVADMFPSALQVISDGRTGYLAQSAGGWYRALSALAGNPALRTQMGNRLRREFTETASVEIMNSEFIQFLRAVRTGTTVPPSLVSAGDRLCANRFRRWAREFEGPGSIFGKFVFRVRRWLKKRISRFP